MVISLEADVVGLSSSLACRVVTIPHKVVLVENSLNHGGGSKEDIVYLQLEGAESFLDGDGLSRDIGPLSRNF